MMILAWVVVVLALGAAFLAHLGQQRLNALGLGQYTAWIAWVRRGFLSLAALAALIGVSGVWMPWSGAIVVLIITIAIFEALRRTGLATIGRVVLGAGAIIAAIIVVVGLYTKTPQQQAEAGQTQTPQLATSAIGDDYRTFKKKIVLPNEKFEIVVPPMNRVGVWPTGLHEHWSERGENLILTVWADEATEITYHVYLCTALTPCHQARPELSKGSP